MIGLQMADDVIKNPNRMIPKPQIPYEPEYVRRGLDPLPAPGTSTVDMFMTVDDSGNIDTDGNEIPFENGHIIDNNDYVNIGYSSAPIKQSTAIPKPKKASPNENIASPDIGEYILMVFGKLILSGSIDKIESKVKNIIYGDDPAFSGIEISMDDIVVLKRVNIKVGIFIDR
jgi:hypothetical protein